MTVSSLSGASIVTTALARGSSVVYRRCTSTLKCLDKKLDYLEMFDSYKTIFEKRGDLYHRAMTKYPHARTEEFEPLLELLQIQDGDVLLDIPAGGCYLKNFLKRKNITIYSLDPTQSMLRHCTESDHGIYGEIDESPLKTHSIDKIFSLAGVHHLADKRPFFMEVQRMLTNRGLFGLADVMAGSNTDRFLNVFVDQFNSMGHDGIFLDQTTVQQLSDCGFTVLYDSMRTCYWRFERREHMTDFFQGLFGLDKATDTEIEEGIETYLGYKQTDGQLWVAWDLYLVKTEKNSDG